MKTIDERPDYTHWPKTNFGFVMEVILLICLFLTLPLIIIYTEVSK